MRAIPDMLQEHLMSHAILPAGTLFLLVAMTLYATRRHRGIRRALSRVTKHLLEVHPNSVIESITARSGDSIIVVDVHAVIAANNTTLELRSFKASVTDGVITTWDEEVTPGLTKDEWQGLLRASSGEWLLPEK